MATTNVTEETVAVDTSNISGRPSFTLQLDNYGLHIKIPFLLSAFFTMIISGVSLIAFIRTRQTPKTARFLCSALLVFDILTILFFTCRKFTSEKRTNILIEFIGIGWSFLAYLNIGIMSFERLVVFQWPNFYLRHVTYGVARAFAFATWTIFIVFYLTFCSSCIAQDKLKDLAICLSMVTKMFIQVTFPTVVIVSITCFLIILLIIKKQTSGSLSERAHTTRMYRSKVVVFTCLINFILTTSLYIGFSTFTVDVDVRRLTLDALTMVNGFVDTCLYVLWYKECRMELMKICSSFRPGLRNDIDKMRVKIFNIVTYDRSLNLTTTRGHENIRNNTN